MTGQGLRVLITGGAGYIGSVLSRCLLEEGYHVTALDNFLYRQNSLLDCCAYDSFHVVRGDCRDEAVMKDLLKTPDIVIPLAALVGAPLCDRDKIGAVTTNLEAIRMLCTLASPHQAVILPVTNSGYGIGQPGVPCTEDSPLRPISLYGESKVQAEKVVLDRGNSLTLRLATVFGSSPRMRMDLLVNDFVWRAIRDRAVVVFEGRFKRNFIHVRDVAKAFVHAIVHFDKMKDRPYNVAWMTPISPRSNCARSSSELSPGLSILNRRSGKIPISGIILCPMREFLKPAIAPIGRWSEGFMN
jgi:nucleoside-diphosphate-sugar epimerase